MASDASFLQTEALRAREAQPMEPTSDPPDWARLARPEVYPEDPPASSIEWRQTHLSHVYLTTARVYKFRKPVDLGFVCFTSQAERNRDCLREVTLNRRLAPDVYLGVAPLLGSAEHPRVGPCAESLAGATSAALEHCVVMRRLPEGRDGLSLLEHGTLRGSEIESLAELLAGFHQANRLGDPAPYTPAEWLAHCTHPAEENFRALADAPEPLAPRELLLRARDRAAAFAEEHGDRFERRRRAGRAVDGHGDLRLEHVWFEAPSRRPLVIDCVEFSESLRRGDVASEIAFGAMDLRYRGSSLAERLLRAYARESDDFDLYSVVDYFVAYRAAVRAKVAAFAARDAALEPGQRERAGESAKRHLTLAADALEPRREARLVLVVGVVGTGKSTVAAELADLLEGAVIASDRVRKRLFELPPTARLSDGWGRGAYTAEHTVRTYAGLLERARPVLESGRTAILDATFSRREQRAAALELTRELDCPAFLVEVHCEAEVARERLARRQAAGLDPSDAGPESHASSIRDFEPLDAWPAARRVRLATDRDPWRQQLAALARRIRSDARR